jgi:hypothetical protein
MKISRTILAGLLAILPARSDAWIHGSTPGNQSRTTLNVNPNGVKFASLARGMVD